MLPEVECGSVFFSVPVLTGANPAKLLRSDEIMHFGWYGNRRVVAFIEIGPVSIYRMRLFRERLLLSSPFSKSIKQ